MTINSSVPSGNILTYSYSTDKNVENTTGVSQKNSVSKKDSAVISNTAKELAAKNAGTSSQEEAFESVSERLAEQAAGTD